MITRYECTNALKDILTDDHQARINALKTLYAADEFAVEPLIDVFYAGVNETTGLIIIAILGDIGGFETGQFFRELIDLSQPYVSWQWAASAAIHNQF